MSGAAGTRTAYRLNVNKTKFYKLAKRYLPEIGPMKRAAFIKYFRVRDYGLDFQSGGRLHHLFLSVCGGAVILSDSWTGYDDEGEPIKGYKAHRPTISELLELGMLEEATPDGRASA